MDTRQILDAVKGVLAAHNAPSVTLPPATPAPSPHTVRWAVLAMIGGGMFASALLVAILVWVLYGRWIENVLPIWHMRFELTGNIAWGMIGVIGITQVALIIAAIKVSSIAIGAGPAQVTIVMPTDAGQTPSPPATIVTTTVQTPPADPTPAPGA